MDHRFSSLLSVLFLAAACGGPLKYNVPSSAAAPGADAKIVADVLEEQNQTQLDIEIVNLAPANRVDPSSKTYVAWYRRDSRETWRRIATLDYDADSREGRMTSSVPLLRFDLEITAEADTDPASPSRSAIFAQTIGED